MTVEDLNRLFLDVEIRKKIDVGFRSSVNFDKNAHVDDIGKHFSFQNREKELHELQGRMQNCYEISSEARTNPRYELLKYFSFSCITGASGIGKTTILTEALFPYLRKLENPAPFLKNCVDHSLYFHISFNPDISLLQRTEKDSFVPIQLLYQYLNISDDFLTKFSRTRLLLSTVLNFISIRENCKEAMVIIHLDETQNLLTIAESKFSRFDTLLTAFLTSLFEGLKSSKSNLYVFPILTGTNSLDLYRFAASSFRYQPLNLPLLEKNHIYSVVNDLISDKKSVKQLDINSFLAKFLDVCIQGHPRLLRAFLSNASEHFLPDKSGLQNKKTNFCPFYYSGFYNLLNNHQEDTTNLWEIFRKTFDEIRSSQFPELNIILSTNTTKTNKYSWIDIRKKLLQLVFSRDELFVNREDLICDAEYGKLEEMGALFLSPAEKNKFSIRIPFLFLHTYAIHFTNYQREPILSSISMLSSEDNEIQDLSTLLFYLWKFKEEGNETIDLNSIIPQVPNKLYEVKFPKNFSIQQLRNQVTSIEAALEVFANSQNQAFLNGKTSPWGDSFLILDFYSGEEKNTWKKLVIILQSKRRATVQEKSRKFKLTTELKKILTSYDTNLTNKYKWIFLIVTDSKSVMEFNDIENFKDKLIIITEKEHEAFYGSYRRDVRSLRDLPQRPKKPKLNKETGSESAKEEEEEEEEGGEESAKEEEIELNSIKNPNKRKNSSTMKSAPKKQKTNDNAKQVKLNPGCTCGPNSKCMRICSCEVCTKNCKCNSKICAKQEKKS